MQVIPIASGKGGVGKTLVSANLAIALAQAGKKVVLADVDLGGSNLHIVIGMSRLKGGIGSFINNNNVTFNSIIYKTDYSNLLFIPGDSEIPGMANLKVSQKRKLLKNLFSLDCDYLIMDLGAGTNYNTIDLFLASGQGIIVTMPTLTATLNAYIFIKHSIFRIMDTSFKRKTVAREHIDRLSEDSSAIQKVYIPKFIEIIRQEDPESYAIFREKIKNFSPLLVMNMIDDPRQAGIAGKLRKSCREYLGLDLEHLGVLYRDDLQNAALNSRLPIIIYKPQALLSQAFYRMSEKLLMDYRHDTNPDEDYFDESYMNAEIEAQADFSAKIQSMEELLHSGTLTSADMIDIIKTQQIELNEMKKENTLLKSKIVKASNAGYKF
ncbi:MAG: P-loop NTPase [Spirochaetia bacterium]|jgi:flagellar biosynthesis protein FlhG|nr:P-loop NTPase [Spirochaetia bacterium]